MQKLFLDVLNLSIVSAWFILAVLCLRLVIKRVAPRWTVCMLWGLVALCLLIPFSFESSFSIIPSRQIVIYSDTPATEENTGENSEVAKPSQGGLGGFQINSGFSSLDERLNAIIENMEQKSRPTESAPQRTDYGKLVLEWSCYIWVSGFAIMLIYFAYNLISLKLKLKKAMQYQDNVYIDESIGAPFLFGIVKPKIYIPLDVTDEAETYVLAHERAHIKRMDHVIKPFGFILLAIHWFNPLVWVAYSMLCRDIEYACDEKVIKNYNEDQRKLYATALLECGVKSVGIAYPVAFGEISVKNRIIKTLNYKRPTLWVILSIIVATVIMAICFLSSPKLVTTINEPDIIPASQKVLGAWYTEGHSLIFEESGEGVYYLNGTLIPFKWTASDSNINLTLTEEYKGAIDLPTQNSFMLSEDGKELTLGNTVYSDTFTPKPRDDIDSALVGTWYSYSTSLGESALTFNSDGTGKSINTGFFDFAFSSFKWTAKDNTLSLIVKVSEKTDVTLKCGSYKIENDKLYLSWLLDMELSKNRLPLGGNTKLAGVWECEEDGVDGKMLTLNLDGTCTLENEHSARHYLWDADGDKIIIYNSEEDAFTADDSPAKTTISYTLATNTLSLTYEGKEYSFTYSESNQSINNTADINHSLGGNTALAGKWNTSAESVLGLELSLEEDGTGIAKALGVDIPVKWYTDSESGIAAIYYQVYDESVIDILYGEYLIIENAFYISDTSGVITCFAKADTDTVSYSLTMDEISKEVHEAYPNSPSSEYIYNEEADGTTYLLFFNSCPLSNFEFTSNGETLFVCNALDADQMFSVKTNPSDAVKGVKFTDPNGNTISFTISQYGTYMPIYVMEQLTIN